jgi:hypothetical protein
MNHLRADFNWIRSLGDHFDRLATSRAILRCTSPLFLAEIKKVLPRFLGMACAVLGLANAKQYRQKSPEACHEEVL